MEEKRKYIFLLFALTNISVIVNNMVVIPKIIDESFKLEKILYYIANGQVFNLMMICSMYIIGAIISAFMVTSLKKSKV